MKLLIVDDSAMIRRAVNNAYQGSVFTDVKTAADGLLALSVFKEQLPDVVTLDITMPYMDGLAALTQMLEIKPNTIVLVISALADNHTAIEALVRGAQQFICKPFTSDDLKEALDTLLEDNSKKIQPESNTRFQVPSPAKQRITDVHTVSANIEERLKKLTRPEQTVPSAESYPSGYVHPPAQSATRHMQIENTTAVSRQKSMHSMFKFKK